MKVAVGPTFQFKVPPTVQAVSNWFRLNTRYPDWTLAPWQHPLVPYLLMGPLVALALLVDCGLLALFPSFALIDLPIMLMVLLLALLWGAAPGLVATLLGTLLLYYVVFPPHFAFRWKDLLDMLESGGVMIGGLLITLVISNHDTNQRFFQQRAQEEAELREHMDTFLMLTSHELRTPLTLLQLQLQRTQRSFANALENGESTTAQLDQTVQRGEAQVTAALGHCSRLNRLVNDLLELARLRMNKEVCNLQGVDLFSRLEKTVDEQRRSAPYPTINLLLPPNTPVRVLADPGQLDLVQRNYLANAIKYSPEGTPVTVGASVEDERVRVWVRDQGPGLPSTEQARIWERFYRAPNIEVQRGSSMGLGIGLYLCQQIIEAHHGTVGVESAPGKGSTFWFTLPLAPAGREDPAK
jgi:signal transduction histidine kinase